MKLWRWEYGRQGGGYSKFTLAYSKRLKFDAYILRLPADVEVPAHNDPSPEGYEHHRVNITLRSASEGGVTYMEMPGGTFIRSPKHYRFRPDLMRHYVSRVGRGEVWLLSIGWLRKGGPVAPAAKLR